MFVPLFLRARHRIEIPIRLNMPPESPPRRIAIVWNREHVVVDRPLGPGWHLLRFDVPRGLVRRGTNLVQVMTRVVPYGAVGAPRLPAPPGSQRAGAALRQMTITIDQPRR